MVKLFEVRSGPKPNKLLGKDRSNRRGNWKLVRPLEPGRFYAKVVPSDDGTAGTSFVCRGDRTETIDTH